MTLNFYIQNPRGLNTKTSQLYPKTFSSEHDLYCLYETWLKPSGTKSSELFSADYDIHRRDRDQLTSDRSAGGGVLIASRKSLKCSRLASFESPDIEEVWIVIELESNRSLYICTFYIPPDSRSDKYIRFFKNLYDIINQCNSESLFLIIGDPNMPLFNWRKTNADLWPSNETQLIGIRHYEELMNLMLCERLSQINHVEYSPGKMLDLIFTNCRVSFQNVEKADPIIKEDIYHPAICLHLPAQVKSPQISVLPPKLNYHKGNYENINLELANIDWRCIENVDINTAVSIFYEIIEAVISNHVPRKNARSKLPIWYSLELIETIRKKDKHRRRFLQHGFELDHHEFLRLRSKENRLLIKCHRKYVQDLEQNLKRRPKQFWEYTKSLRKTNTYPVALTDGINIAEDFDSVANMFASHFSSVHNSTNSDPDYTNLFPPDENQECLFTIDPTLVHSILSNLDIHKGAGCDSIPNIFLKKCAHNLFKPLTELFQMSLNQGVFPDLWKETRILPIFKKDDPNNVSNYRPIAILNAVEKVFEKVIHLQLLNIVQPQLSNTQHGFLPGKSTLTNLL